MENAKINDLLKKVSEERNEIAFSIYYINNLKIYYYSR